MSTALVTGATAGIGAAFARQLAARGDDLVLVARDADRLATIATELQATHGVAVETLQADLSDADDLHRVAERVASAEKRVDLLVNNAGFGPTASLLDDLGEHDRAWAVMGEAVVVLSNAAARAMVTRGHGRVLNVASLSAWVTQGEYSAIKSFVKLYNEALAGELRGTGVTATALCPGWVTTEFHERASIQTSAIPTAVWVDADRCVREALAHADAGRVVSLPTKRWKAMAIALQLAPRPLVRALSGAIGRDRRRRTP
ncbi:SDR family NAD(P)-dependent oxidoreductase [Propioniciclava soli]|uniref:SDR family NAD(P)-dependent oxidoreductase n=1 Tax=Propioniciclava soli TaxID=2775081 RepID=UPI001E54ADF9|nr:SDR family NAD(P)-dependent oxidoreductase [Propioniciclava soli]